MNFVGVEVVAGATAWLDASEDAPISVTNLCLATAPAARGARVAVEMCAPEGGDGEGDGGDDGDGGEGNAPARGAGRAAAAAAAGARPVIAVLSAREGGAENVRMELLVNSRMGVRLAGGGVAGAVVHLVGHRVEVEGPPGVMDEADLDALTDDEMAALAEATGNGDLNGLQRGDDPLAMLESSDGESESDSDAECGSESDGEGEGERERARGGRGTGEGATEDAAARRREARLAGRTDAAGGGGVVVASPGGKIMTHSSGLRYQELLVGSGRAPTVGRNVAIKYTLRLESGKVVDRSGRAPFKFRLGIGEVVKGMDLGVQGMREGGSRHLIIPPRLGYGREGSPPAIPRNSTLFFDVTLVKVWK